MKRIGFIGLGIMGLPMARHLMEKGYALYVYTRTRSKAQPLLDEGAIWCDGPGTVTFLSDAVITMVGFVQDVEDVYFKKDGIIANAKPRSYLIDMTTTSPTLSARIYDAAKEKGAHALDAPVSGGETGAQNAALSIMAGGDREAYEACLPLFECMGAQITYTGAAGSGQHTKMANQIAISGALAGVCEAIAYGRQNGLNLDTMLKSISKGAAGSWQMENLGPRILQGDLAPGFFMKHFIKDMGIALSEEQDLSLQVLKTVYDACRELQAQGLGDCGTQALIRHYCDVD
ncbi:MAG: NAD(P)-dependent oxidoreductase [Christensenellales bacterium]|jgi:3-hydroxyisobutyrate dehydrogenase-like beta-hydroxyacid dehydrogenase